MKKVLTIILDGFGYRESEEGNAIKAARMKNFEYLWQTYPHTTLYASEEPIGLKQGQFGNSEIGHETIGAGRIVKQNEALVNELLDNLDDNLTFQMLIDYIRCNPDKKVHLMGLCSDGLVHSNMEHLKRIYQRLVDNGVNNIFFHLVTDGRDTTVNSAINYIGEMDKLVKDNAVGSIASLCGRYYAMDRDKKYDRTKKYYDLITKAKGISFSSYEEALNKFYENDITDEFIEPTILDPQGVIEDNDSVIWINYRSDRSKQIVDALTNPQFDGFDTIKYKNLNVYTFFQLDKNIKSKNFLPLNQVENPLGIYLSELGLTQARVAETEKYPHVTYFFDGSYNGKVDKCDKYLIPSPKVATYDLKPEMSAVDVTKKVISCMQKDYDFILVNFANPDMVGHTGSWNAAVKACVTVDVCLGKILEVADENFYKIVLLADHGNADIMYDEEKRPVTTHTLSKVPFIITDPKVKLKEGGSLINVAPTILEYMDIALPQEMQDTPSLISGYID